jgi:hypothetical protein
MKQAWFKRLGGFTFRSPYRVPLYHSRQRHFVLTSFSRLIDIRIR